MARTTLAAASCIPVPAALASASSTEPPTACADRSRVGVLLLLLLLLAAAAAWSGVEGAPEDAREAGRVPAAALGLPQKGCVRFWKGRVSPTGFNSKKLVWGLIKRCQHLCFAF
jgi:hypothetical protein